jgi:hypothetical protein
MFLLKNLFSFSWLFVGNIVPLQKKGKNYEETDTLCICGHATDSSMRHKGAANGTRRGRRCYQPAEESAGRLSTVRTGL